MIAASPNVRDVLRRRWPLFGFAGLVGWTALIACGSDRRIVYIDCDADVVSPPEPIEPEVDAALEGATEDAPIDARRDAPGHVVERDAGDPDAPWTTGGDTFTNAAYDLAFGDDETVYLASYFGVYESTDVGRVWVPKNSGLLAAQQQSARAIVTDPANPSRLYLGTRYNNRPDYMFTSADGAESWTAMDLSYPTRREYDIKKLLVDPTLGLMIAAKQVRSPWAPVFLTADEDGGFRATVVVDQGDAGSEDFAIPIGLVGTADDLFFTVFGGLKGRGGIFHSVNGGRDWTESDEGIAPEHKQVIACLARSPSTPTTLFAGVYLYPTTTTVIYKSTDNGAHWRSVGTGYPNDDSGVTALAVHPTDPNIVYAGFSYGYVYKTTDGGDLWTLSRAPIREYEASINFIEFHPADPRTVFVGKSDNLLVTRNGGGEP